ncbi:MAG: twin-arginine translocase TatA/TatE family subunit [Dehalococcoidales bacterium]
MRPPGPLEIGLIVLIILIVFGVGKLPQVGAALGKGINAFKRGTRGEDIDDDLTTTKKKTKRKTKKTVKKAEPVAGKSPAAVEEKPAEGKPAAEDKPADTETETPTAEA